jgi:ribulose-phosphate 3-epimerase
MAAGLALNPASPLALIQDVLADLDLLLIMSVNPGFGGQSYLTSATEKIQRARGLLDGAGARTVLEVDGGITIDTIATAWRAGADTFVAGTAVFGQPDIPGAVRALRQACVERA